MQTACLATGEDGRVYPEEHVKQLFLDVQV